MNLNNSQFDDQRLAGGFSTEADRSRRLVDAASDLLQEDGLEGLTIRAVLTRTGLARRAFYECFAGKDDLVLAVFEETLAQAAIHFRDRTAAATTPLGKIEVFVIGLVTGAIVEQEGYSHQWTATMVREHLRLAQTRPGKLQAALQPLLDFVAELVTEGVRAGQLRSCDPVLQAALIYNLIATTLHSELMMREAAAEQSGSAHKKQLTDQIWEFCRRAIVA